jgi:hypothetical protein
MKDVGEQGTNIIQFEYGQKFQPMQFTSLCILTAGILGKTMSYEFLQV